MRWEVEDLKKTHVWFAWFPVLLASGERAWLERVQRRQVFVCEVGATYQYHRIY